MAYRDLQIADGIGSYDVARGWEIRLGEVERHVILQVRRDAQARRTGARIADARLEALRLYAMLGRYRRDGARPLSAAGFSPAERRVVDAMLDALPLRRPRTAPPTGRLLCALVILLPLLAASAAYGWADIYLGDRLIALVLSGLAALMLLPLAQMLVPARRPAQPRR